MVREAFVTSVMTFPVSFEMSHVSIVPIRSSPASARSRRFSGRLALQLERVGVVEDPLDFRRREVGVRLQPGLSADPLDLVLGLQFLDAVRRPPVLPDEGVVDRVAGLDVPDERRLALVRDTDGGQLFGLEVRLVEGPDDDGLRVLPDFDGVVFYPAGFRVDLFVFLVRVGDDLPAVVEHHEEAGCRSSPDRSRLRMCLSCR